MTTTRKLTTLKRKWITQNTDLYSWKKIESYRWTKWNWRHVHSKSETKTNKQKEQQKNNYKSLNIILPFPFFFSLFPFRPNISIFLSFILSVCKYFHPFFPFSVDLVFLFVCLVPSVLLQLKIIKSVSIWRIPYLNVIELLVYPFSEDFMIMH